MAVMARPTTCRSKLDFMSTDIQPLASVASAIASALLSMFGTRFAIWDLCLPSRRPLQQRLRLRRSARPAFTWCLPNLHAQVCAADISISKVLCWCASFCRWSISQKLSPWTPANRGALQTKAVQIMHRKALDAQSLCILCSSKFLHTRSWI